MPRKQFKADLNDATEGNHSVQFITDCRPDEDDGQFTFVFAHPQSATPVTITAGVSELSDYPATHTYTIWCDDNASPEMAAKVEKVGMPVGKSITQLLSLVSATLCGAQMSDYDSDDLQEEDSDDEDVYIDDPLPSLSTASSASSNMSTRVKLSNTTFHIRIRKDLKCVKDAGFKLAYFGGLLDGHRCVVSVSISARKLGISEEAMRAWRIEPTDYIILLLQYKDGYKTIEELGNLDSASLHRALEMHVGASKHYKPTQQQALNAFATSTNTSSQEPNQKPFLDTFVSKPLNNLLNDRLVSLIRLRASGMSWQGAEDFYRLNQGMSLGSITASTVHYAKEKASGYPPIVDADHLATCSTKDHSFPLVAMQFMLRHFVRCTEFCLVCHSKLDTLVEALKPYVCDSPLCLYQYMSLGFGPSIEHEILAQSSVVDLLLSFCYTSAHSGRLMDFPTGLALNVPQNIIVGVPQKGPVAGAASSISTAKKVAPLKARYDMSKQELLFDDVKPDAPCPLRQGDWIAMEFVDDGQKFTSHCRVANTSLFPTIRTNSLIGPTRFLSGWRNVLIGTYSVNFDDLSDAQKRGVLYRLLGLLPSVKEMNSYLVRQRTPNLSQWAERISPAALAVLRWTIASNRACIMEVEPEKAVYGMPDFMQFRFAMGAPDKEQRFVTAVNETKVRLSIKYPTIYMWHGSALDNWHSIIREGLNFRDVLNGRAWGHGVYHARDFTTSSTYCGAVATKGLDMWPNSNLQVTAAIALNEVVNAPAEFVSSHPYYVVSQVDWIQTRYLFVKCINDDTMNKPIFDKMPVSKLAQDPERIPTGVNGAPLVIPAAVIKATKRKLANTTSPGPKRTKKSRTEKTKSKHPKTKKVIDLTEDEDNDANEPYYRDENGSDGLSVATDDEDREIFRKPDFQRLVIRNGPPQSDFVPGSLKHDALPKLPMPSYANTVASKRLKQDLAALLDVQKKTPLHELGWYIDPEKVENIYQWIVELHSFHMFNEKGKDLPLSTDMKKHGVKSIVLELRFPGSYPINPPFIRVVRPRFLPFMSGGGGHVTAGGAICHMLLTSDGWLPTNTIESVLLQIRMAIASTEPKPARLQLSGIYTDGDRNSYGSREAVDAYKRACLTHGWTIPADFDQTTAEGQ
jgi:ubiquitin-conjugating enzyme E2 Q